MILLEADFCRQSFPSSAATSVVEAWSKKTIFKHIWIHSYNILREEVLHFFARSLTRPIGIPVHALKEFLNDKAFVPKESRNASPFGLAGRGVWSILDDSIQGAQPTIRNKLDQRAIEYTCMRNTC
jgi:hypothetical protein